MIFVDTAFWVAFRNERDINHARARELMTIFFERKETLAITDHIFAEAHAFFVRSIPKREQIMRDLLDNPIVQHLRVTPEEQELTLKWLKEFRDKHWSYVDALSFAVISKREIPAAVSFDDHFGQPGTFQWIH